MVTSFSIFCIIYFKTFYFSIPQYLLIEVLLVKSLNNFTMCSQITIDTLSLWRQLIKVNLYAELSKYQETIVAMRVFYNDISGFIILNTLLCTIISMTWHKILNFISLLCVRMGFFENYPRCERNVLLSLCIIVAFRGGVNETYKIYFAVQSGCNYLIYVILQIHKYHVHYVYQI